MRVSNVAKYLYWGGTFKLRLRLRQQRCIDRIKKSGLFDEDYYALWNPDVDPAFVDPVGHYVMSGADECRDPHPLFSTEFYRSQYPDVDRRGVNPFDHWLQVGVREGRSPHPLLSDRSGRKSGRKSAVSEAKDVLLRDGEQRSLVLRAETERREKGRSAAGVPLFKRLLPFDHKEQLPHLEPITRNPRTIVALMHQLPGRRGALGQSAKWRLLDYFEEAGDRVVPIYCALSGQEEDASAVEEAAAYRRNFIAVSLGGEVKMKLEEFFSDFEKTFALGPVVSPLLRDSPFVSQFVLDAGGSLLGVDAFLEVLARLNRWMPERSILLASSLAGTSFLTSVGGSVLKLVDAREENLEGFEEELLQALEEGELATLKHEIFSQVDYVLVDLDQVPKRQSVVPAEKVVALRPDFSEVATTHHILPGHSDSPAVLLVGSGSREASSGFEEFVRFVWPLILETHPGTTLGVVGLSREAVPEGILGVSFFAISEVFPEHYARARLIVNSTQQGVGLVRKSLEALAYGLPVVTWPSGVYGLPPEVSRYCSVASDVYEFANKIRGFLDEEIDSQRGVASRQAAADYFSEGKPYRLLEEAVSQFFEQVRDGEESASGLAIPGKNS